MGLVNAVTSLASATGSALAGLIYDASGFAALAGATFIAVASGLMLNELWLRPSPTAPTPAVHKVQE